MDTRHIGSKLFWTGLVGAAIGFGAEIYILSLVPRRPQLVERENELSHELFEGSREFPYFRGGAENYRSEFQDRVDRQNILLETHRKLASDPEFVRQKEEFERDLNPHREKAKNIGYFILGSLALFGVGYVLKPYRSLRSVCCCTKTEPS